jgi:SNF2 family DNA or RNA helicase
MNKVMQSSRLTFQLTSDQTLYLLDPNGNIVDDTQAIPLFSKTDQTVVEQLNDPLSNNLLEDLSHVNLVDELGNPIEIETIEQSFDLHIFDQHQSAYLQFHLNDQPISVFSMITPTYLWVENSIVAVPSVGNNFSLLDGLQGATFVRNDLEKLLSIIASDHTIALKYKNYDHITTKEATLKPSLVYEKIDANDALHIRFGATFANFSPSFFRDHTITTIIQLDNINQEVRQIPLNSDTIEPAQKAFERRLKKHIKKFDLQHNFIIRYDCYIISHDLAKAFIYAEFSTMYQNFTLFNIELLKRYNITHYRPKLSLQLNSGINFFEGSASVTVEDQTFEVDEFIQTYETNQFIPLPNGGRAMVDHHYVTKLKRLLKPTNDGVKISFFDMPLVESVIEANAQKEQFTHVRKVYEGFNTIKKPTLPATFKATLRPYQEEGVAWLNYLYENSLGGCLADDMGLGKTVQMIALLTLITSKQPKAPILIVLPVSLLFNWESELAKFAPSLTYTLHTGKDRKKEPFSTDLVLTTYGTLRTDSTWFQIQTFDTTILDESQAIKNPNAKTTLSVYALNVKHRFVISGTPIENSLRDLYAQFRFINPTMFGSGNDFKDHYITPITNENDEEVAKELRAKIYPFILRRTKAFVAKDLPKRTDNFLYCQMSNEQAKLYETTKKRYFDQINQKVQTDGLQKSKFLVFQAFNELRQIASQPEKFANTKGSKLKEIENFLDELLEENHNILIFTSYLDTIDELSDLCKQKNIGYLSMQGATKNRANLVKKFNEDDNTRVFILSLKVGAVGLNLTKADYVFIYDPWWNKAIEEQAIDRAHRIGQTRNVFSYKMIMKGTIEEKIIELQQQKGKLVDQLISDDFGVKSLNQEIINYIFNSTTMD